MTRRLAGALCSSLGIGAILLSGSARAQEAVPPPPPAAETGTVVQPATPAQAQPTDVQGVQPLASGPVNEAYAEPSVRGPVPTPVVPNQPPAPIPEVPPDQKPDDASAIWIPGYWSWEPTNQDFVWVSGVWRVPPPGYQWAPGYWAQAEGGWQWVPGFWQPSNVTEVNYLPEPPDPVNEAVPPAPDQSSFFVPGCWVWQTSRYMWRPGFWLGYQNGWVWDPASYFWTPSGYVYVAGHWDRPLGVRGLLFAPVLIQQAVWQQPGWTYTPSYVVDENYLLGALFVQPAYTQYFFGDYFGQRYRDRGFVPWIDFRIGRDVLSPLLAYYSWSHRTDRNWYRDLNTLYVGRERGLIPVPARTFAQERAQIARVNRDITVNGVTLNRNRILQSMTALTPLSQANRITRLTRVTAQERTALRNHANQLREVSKQRTDLERRLATTPRTAREQVRAARLTLPRSPVSATATRSVHAPAAPHEPQVREAPVRHTVATPGHERERTTVTQPRATTNPRQVVHEPMPERREPATQTRKVEPRPEPKVETRKPEVERARPTPKPEVRQERPQPRPAPHPAPKPEHEERPAPHAAPHPAPHEQHEDHHG